MTRWRSKSPSVVVGFLAVWPMTVGLIWFGMSEAAQDSFVNCNEVMLADRCACNERMLRALALSRPIFLDPTQGGNALDATAAISIQQERQHLLRTFIAPGDCEHNSSVKRLPIAQQHTGGKVDLKAIKSNLKPLRTKDIDVVDEGIDPDMSPDQLLIGRWEGWQTLFGGKPSTMSLHVISVEAQGRLVSACSDQGMMFLRVKDGYLELPRTDSVGMAYSIRLWRSTAPHSQDLEGVALLEVRPGEVLVAGLVWLSRAVRFDWSTPASSYFCQDRDLEERKKLFREIQERKWEREEKLPLMQLKEQVQQLKRELDAVRSELEASRSQGDVSRQGLSMDAK